MNAEKTLGCCLVRHLRLSAFICGSLVAPPALAAPRVQVDAGWNGRARAGCWAPVRVTISGLTEPIDGQIEIEVDDGSGTTAVRMGYVREVAAPVRTARPVSIVPGGAKRFSLQIVPGTIYISGALPIAVTARLRHRGRVVATGRGSLRLLPIGSRLLVTATGEPAGLQGWDGRARRDLGWAAPAEPEDPSVAEPIVRVAHVAPESLPEVWSGYDAADLVVIRGPAWLRMSDRQRRALRRWVEGGGRALLCGEQAGEWRDAEARLLLPGTLADRALPASELMGESALGRSGQIAAATIEPRASARPFLRAGGAADGPLPVVGCSAPTGFGVALWMGIDPFRDEARRGGALWRRLVAEATGAPVSPSRVVSLADNPTAKELANTLPRLPAPSRGLLGSIAVAYILIFGPLNIRILRLLSRGPVAWLFLPALALVMTAVLLLIGRSWGQSRALLNRVSVVEVMSGAATGHEQGLNGLFSPTNALYTVAIEDPAVLLDLRGEQAATTYGATPMAYGGVGGTPYGPPTAQAADPARPNLRAGLMPTLQLEESSRWESLPLALWTLQNQAYDRLTDLGGGVTVSLTRRSGGHPAGTVRNETPFRLARAYLQFEGYRLSLGDIAPGQARGVPHVGWARRRLADSGLPAPGSYLPAPGTGSREPGASSALYEQAIVLLRAGGREHEALLVAEAPELMAKVTIGGVTEVRHAVLLLVRARVEGSS